MTGTIISAKGTFKNHFKTIEKQAIPIMVFYTILALMIALVTISLNLLMTG